MQINLAVTGWGYTIGVASDVPKVGAIVVTTRGHKGLRVQAHAAEWSSEIALTGEAQEYGPFAACITPLDADYYIVTVDGAQDENGKATQLEARVQVDKRFVPSVEFVYHEPPPAAAAAPAATQQAETPATVVDATAAGLDDDSAATTAATFTEDEPDAGALPKTSANGEGADAAFLVAASVVEPPVARGPACLSGVAPDAGGRNVRVIDAVGNELRTTADSEGRFRFDPLPPGVYSLFVEGGYQQAAIELDGTADVDILFAPVIAVWETTVTNAGSMPGYSSVRVEVEGMTNLPVRIWQGDEEGRLARTGSSQAGAHVAEFRDLPLGRHMIEPEGLGVWAEVEITGLEALWVSFRRKAEPLGPNEVRRTPPLARSDRFAAAVSAYRAQSFYIYLSTMPATVEQQVALLRFVSAHEPGFGSDLEAAAQADLVLLIEDERAGGAVAQQLLLRNVPVERVAGDWNQFFARFGS